MLSEHLEGFKVILRKFDSDLDDSREFGVQFRFL